MKKIMILLCMVFSLLFVGLGNAIEVCEYEQDPFSLCNIVTPAGMTCTTYNIYAPDNSTNVSNGALGVVNAAAGIYSASFNQSTAGGYIIQLCDNSTAQVNIKTTDETDLATILVNQATLETEILEVNTTTNDILDDITDNSTNGFFYRWWVPQYDWLNQQSAMERIATQNNLTSGGVINATAIAIEVLLVGDLGNKTVTFNDNDDIANMTTVYNDLGFEYIEEFRYNSSDKFYLNSTLGRRIV